MIYFEFLLKKFLPAPMLTTEPSFLSSLHTEVVDVLDKIEKLRAFRPAFTRTAGAAVVLVCSVLAWKAHQPKALTARPTTRHNTVITRAFPVLVAPTLKSYSSGHVAVTPLGRPAHQKIARVAKPSLVKAPGAKSHVMKAAPVMPAANPTLVKVAPSLLKEVASKVSRVALPVAKKPLPPPQMKPAAPAVGQDDDEDDQDDVAATETDLVENYIESAPVEEPLAVELTTPLDEVTTKAFSEASLTEDYHSDTLLSAAQLDPSFTIDRDYPREKRLARSEGLILKNELAEIKGTLANLEVEAAAFTAVEAPKPAPEPELVMPARAVAKVEKAQAEKKFSKMTTQATSAPPVIKAETVPLAPVAASKPEPTLVAPVKTEKVARVAPVEQSVPSESVAVEARESSRAVTPSVLSPVLAGVGSLGELASQPLAAAATTQPGALAFDARVDLPSKGVTLDARRDLPTVKKESAEPVLAMPAPKTVASPPVTLASATPKTIVSEGPRLAAGPPIPPGFAAVPPAKAHAPVAVAPQAPAKAPQVAMRGLNDDEIEGDKLLVDVVPDDAMDRWLNENSGHFALYLHPAKSRDRRDGIHIEEYEFPERQVLVDMEGMKGEYRLAARVFDTKATTGYEPIFSEPFTTANRRFTFRITKTAFDEAQARGKDRSSPHLMTLTVFEGGSGDPLKPQPVANGMVRIVGFKGVGPFLSDAAGNVRIPYVPGRSELMLEVTADGYYPSYPIVPTLSTEAYHPIYLLRHQVRSGDSKLLDDYVDGYFSNLSGFLRTQSLGLAPEQLALLKRMFAPRPAAGKDAAAVMGRIFDPRTRRPHAGEEVSMLFRKGHALYFNTLSAAFTLLANPLDILPSLLDVVPDPKRAATAENGLFGFFNIKPSFRTVNRESGKPGYLFNLRPGSAQYIEFGRSGEKSFRGRVIDPFTGAVPVGRVRLAGTVGFDAEIGDDGRFTLPQIDFPPGVITLEIEAKGYPTTWHTVPWDAHERETEQTLFLVPKETGKTGGPSIAWSKLRKDRGSVLGGAEVGFFGKRNGCVFVSLEDTAGNVMGGEHGPFPFTGTGIPKGAPLCLSAQRPGFVFFDLPSGEYVLKWVNAKGHTFRTHLVRVGLDRASVIVN